MKIQIVIVLIASLVAASPAAAEVYRWVDDRGVIGYTEDFGRIPEKYRKNATVVGEDQGSEIQPVQEPLPGVRPSTSGAGGKAQQKPEQVKKEISYGGKDPSFWRGEFSRLKGELRGIRDQRSAVGARLADTSRMSRDEYKTLEATRKLLEEQESETLKKLETLNAEADRYDVPAELRQ
jgi:hypothetical protein